MNKILKIFFSTIIFYFGCSGPKTFTVKDKEPEAGFVPSGIRILVDENLGEKEILIEVPSYIYAEGKKIILINSGNKLSVSANDNGISLKIKDNYFEAEYFQIFPKDTTQFLTYNGMKLRGSLKIVNDSNSVAVINTLDLESYLKGIVPKEMPLGKNEEYFQALKAFTICARTYSLNKMKRTGDNFDVYIDTRDQVYGGVDTEREISNKAVEETKELVLTYEGEIATVFYHSTCGGKTEAVQNVFGFNSTKYMQGIEDGNSPYCSISPSFKWEETYSQDLLIERLRDAGLIDSEYYQIDWIGIISRFESGRVNELRIELLSTANERKTISLFGNNIRSIIRTANNKSILKSIWFDVDLDIDRNVIITGKGYGHGVGFCQWGAINQSKLGYDFREILYHYFPGTKISYLNDNI